MRHLHRTTVAWVVTAALLVPGMLSGISAASAAGGCCVGAASDCAAWTRSMSCCQAPPSATPPASARVVLPQASGAVLPASPQASSQAASAAVSSMDHPGCPGPGSILLEPLFTLHAALLR